MYESENIARTLERLCVKITTTQGLGGSAILYQSKNKPDLLYIFTAKHCLLGVNFDIDCKSEDISIQLFNSEPVRLSVKDQILYHPEEDVCVIQVSKAAIISLMGEIPGINLVADNGGELTTVFYGYPNAFPDNRPVRANATIIPPINKYTIWLESTIRSEQNLTEFTVQGFSGSGVGLICSGEVYLLGIVTHFEEWGRFKCCSITALNELLGKYGSPELVTIIETNPELISGCRTLNNNTNDLLSNIDEKIATVHLDRADLIKEAEELIANNNVVMIYGGAGSGKSSLTKELLLNRTLKYGTKVITLAGSQICRNSLTETLAALHVNQPLDALLKSKDWIGSKIIYIDSAEKAIESNFISVLKDLLLLPAKHEEIKVILSIRSYALTQTAFSLINDLHVLKAKLEVDLLTDDELQPLIEAYPKVGELLNNKKVTSFVRTPFYLKQIMSILDELNPQATDERELKVKLWSKIVARDNLNRERLFQKIAIERAIRLAPFISLAEPFDNAVLKELLFDNIIVERIDELGDRQFAPSHDIFEDWALVRFIGQGFRETPDILSFLGNLSSAYAIQRGFRFWLQELYRIDNQAANHIALQVLNSPGFEKWKNEVITSLLSSSVCTNFLNDNASLLLNNDGKLLIQCIHLLRTTCKTTGNKIVEPDLNDAKIYLSSTTLLPIGPGWLSVLQFINDNYDHLRTHHVIITYLLIDWKNGLEEDLMRPEKPVAELVEKVLDTFLQTYKNDNAMTGSLVHELIMILFQLPEAAPQLVQQFLDRSVTFFKTPVEKPAHHLRAFHKEVLKTALSWKHSKLLCKCFPDLIIQIAKNHWILPPDTEIITKGPGKSVRSAYHVLPHSDRDISKEEMFGLQSEYKRNFNPASAYQTPIPHLLEFHTEPTVSFIIGFLNELFEKLLLHPASKTLELTSVTLTLESGKQIVQTGNAEFWSMYRGGQRSPHLLQSILMGLERYLLEFKHSSKENKEKWISVVNRLIEESNNISVTAVAASASMAYPFIAGDSLLVFLRSKETILWDFQRMVHERDFFQNISFYDQPALLRWERMSAEEFSVRKEYLERLAFKMSLYEGFMDKILTILDIHNQNLASALDPEFPWPHILRRMDRRNFQFTAQDNGESLGILVEPKAEVFGADFENGETSKGSAITVWSWCHNIIDKDIQEQNTISDWRSYLQICKKNIEENSVNNALFNAPSDLAAIGLKWHLSDLTADESKWCIEIIIDSAMFFVTQDRKQYNYEDLDKYSIKNKESALTTLPLLFSLGIDEAQRIQIQELVVSHLHRMEISNGLDKPLFERICSALWKYNNPLFWQCFRSFQSMASDKSISWNTVPEFIQKAFEGKTNEISTYNFETGYLNQYFTDKSYLCIAQSSDMGPEGRLFIESYLDHLLNETYQKKDVLRGWRSDTSTYYEGKLHFYSQFGNIVLDQPKAVAVALFGKFLGSFLIDKDSTVEHLTNDSLEFGNKCLNEVIRRQDIKPQSERFNELWKIIAGKTIESSRSVFLKQLLLNIGWKDDATTWSAVEENPELFGALIKLFGSLEPESSIKLVSGIGFDSLFPKSISVIAAMIESLTKQYHPNQWLNSYASEKFIQRAFFMRGSEIRGNSELRDKFITILDAMTERGSSIAFIIKENISSVSELLRS